MAKPWTTSEIKKLRENYDGLTFKQLVALLPDRTVSALTNKARQLKLTKKNVWTPEKSKKAVELRKQGMGYQAIADILGFADRRVIDSHFRYLHVKGKNNG